VFPGALPLLSIVVSFIFHDGAHFPEHYPLNSEGEGRALRAAAARRVSLRPTPSPTLIALLLCRFHLRLFRKRVLFTSMTRLS
jgi:hypothetical protein